MHEILNGLNPRGDARLIEAIERARPETGPSNPAPEPPALPIIEVAVKPAALPLIRPGRPPPGAPILRLIGARENEPAKVHRHEPHELHEPDRRE